MPSTSSSTFEIHWTERPHAPLSGERSLQATAPARRSTIPILFNYRQFIELSLKYLIATYGPSVEVEAIWKSHDLSVLWTRFQTVVEGFGVADHDGADEAVGRIVAEFAVVDPGSFSHRYPVDTKGRPIALALDHVDLVALADVMNAVDGYFTGCDGYLDALESAAP